MDCYFIMVKEIDLKNIPPSYVPLVIDFFETELENNHYVWDKKEKYAFKDGTSFKFANDVFCRKRKPSHEQIRPGLTAQPTPNTTSHKQPQYPELRFFKDIRVAQTASSSSPGPRFQ